MGAIARAYISIAAVNDGKGVRKVTAYYLATAQASGVTEATAGWTAAVQAVTAAKRHLWTYEATEWTDGSVTKTAPHIVGVYGDAGISGKDAYTVTLVPAEIVLDTDNKGIVGNPANAYADVVAYKGNVKVTPSIGTLSASRVSASKSGTRVTLTAVGTDPATGTSYGSGHVDIPVTVDGITFVRRLEVRTNVHKVVAEILKYDDRIEQKVSRKDYDADNVAVNERMTRIEQTAERISLEVREQARPSNLLPGTAFRNGDTPEWTRFAGKISETVRYNGHNSVLLASRQGLVYRGIPVRPDTVYSLSFACLLSDADSRGVVLIVNAVLAGGATVTLMDSGVKPSTADAWEVCKRSFTTPSDAVTVTVTLVSPPGNFICISCPMLSEGEYTPWQPSDSDMVSDKALKGTGIDIRNRTIDMTADRFTLRNNKGEKTMGVDEAGNMELSGTLRADAVYKHYVNIVRPDSGSYVLGAGSFYTVDGSGYSGYQNPSDERNLILLPEPEICAGREIEIVNAMPSLGHPFVMTVGKTHKIQRLGDTRDNVQPLNGLFFVRFVSIGDFWLVFTKA